MHKHFLWMTDVAPEQMEQVDKTHFHWMTDLTPELIEQLDKHDLMNRKEAMRAHMKNTTEYYSTYSRILL